MSVARKFRAPFREVGFNPAMTRFDHTSHMPLAERLAAYDRRRQKLADAGMNVSFDAIANMLGVHRTNAHRIFSGARKRMTMEEERAVDALLTRLEREVKERTGVDLRAGASARGAHGYEPEPRQPVPLATARRLPVYGLASAGTRVELVHASVVDYLDMDDLLGARAPAERFIVEVTGACMEPRLFQGERVLAIRNRPPRPGEDCVIEFADGSAQIKRYMGRRGGDIHALQYNDTADGYDPAGHFFPVNAIKALHAVVANLG